jgi:hypothetical protein
MTTAVIHFTAGHEVVMSTAFFSQIFFSIMILSLVVQYLLLVAGCGVGQELGPATQACTSN